MNDRADRKTARNRKDPKEVIRSFRMSLRESQYGMARALGVTFSTVNRWENGRVKPSKLAASALRRLAKEREINLAETPWGKIMLRW